MEKVLKVVKELAPYIVSLLTAFFAYKQSLKGFKNELKKLENEHKNDLEKLNTQHTIDIENLKQKHQMELEVKEKDHKHEIEMQKLKSESIINEKNQEMMGNAMTGVIGSVFQDMLTGKISAEDLEKFSKQFSKK